MRSLFDYILWAVAFVFFIIGIDQSVKGFQSYWAFMISLSALFALNLRKSQQKPENEKPTREQKTETFVNNAQKKDKSKKEITPAKKRKRS